MTPCHFDEKIMTAIRKLQSTIVSIGMLFTTLQADAGKFVPVTMTDASDMPGTWGESCKVSVKTALSILRDGDSRVYYNPLRTNVEDVFEDVAFEMEHPTVSTRIPHGWDSIQAA